MFAVRSMLSRGVPVMRTAVCQRATVVSGPPKFPMAITEKVGIGTLMITLILAPTVYLVTNIKNYRARV
jgi:hypothetical protein